MEPATQEPIAGATGEPDVGYGRSRGVRGRSFLLGAVLVCFAGPALVFGSMVLFRTLQAKPHVDSLRTEAAAAGLELMPESLLAIDMMDPDDVPPGALAQDEFMRGARPLFHGEPVHAEVLYWPLLVVAGFLLTFWALAGLAIAAAVHHRGFVVGALACVVALAVLWLPMAFYRDVIDVVTYYVE